MQMLTYLSVLICGFFILNSVSKADQAFTRAPKCLTTSTTKSLRTDVAIVGAGAAGIAAAVALAREAPELDIKIFEMRDVVGGRVRSSKFGQGNWTLEDGAGWQLERPDVNPVWNLLQDYEFQLVRNEVEESVWYDRSGKEVDDDLLERAAGDIYNLWDASIDLAVDFLDNGRPPDDVGLVNTARRSGMTAFESDTIVGDVEYSLFYNLFILENEQTDTSLRNMGGFMEGTWHAIVDQNGWYTLFERYLFNNLASDSVRFNSRVVKIEYDGADLTGRGKSRLTIMDPDRSCYSVTAQRTIVTTSVGVLSHRLIEFVPPLKYSFETHNPFRLGQFNRIRYQFPSVFWEEETEVIVVAREPEKRGECSWIRNLHKEGFLPGSRILECALANDALYKLMDGADYRLGNLSNSILEDLIQPLRDIYGSDQVGDFSNIEVSHVDLNRDPSTGYGAWANMLPGYGFVQMYQFYGGNSLFTPHCLHNGCNANSEWILHFSGSCSCFAHWKWVDSAFLGGERSAKHVLKSMGYQVDTNSYCEEPFGSMTELQFAAYSKEGTLLRKLEMKDQIDAGLRVYFEPREGLSFDLIRVTIGSDLPRDLTMPPYDVFGEQITIPGKYDISVEVYQEGKQISSHQLQLEIQEAPRFHLVQATEPYGALRPLHDASAFSYDEPKTIRFITSSFFGHILTALLPQWMQVEFIVDDELNIISMQHPYDMLPWTPKAAGFITVEARLGFRILSYLTLIVERANVTLNVMV